MSVFQWPPRTITDASPPTTPADHTPAPPATAGTLPPAAPPRVRLDGLPFHRPVAHPSPAPTAPLLFDIQQTWLDLLVPPLRRRLDLLQWQPESPDAYCHRCGQSVGPHDATPQGCRQCIEQRRPWSNLVRLGEYAPPLSDVVHEIKFTRWRRLAYDAGAMLGEALAAAVDAQRDSLNDYLARKPLLVPVPMSFRRRMIRGIHHALSIARGVQETFECELADILQRRHRPSQLVVAPHKRPRNVAGTMWTRVPPRRLDGRLIIVVDDVTTTGATLRAATNAIQARFRSTLGKTSRSSPVSDGKRANPKARLGTEILVWTAVLTVTRKESER